MRVSKTSVDKRAVRRARRRAGLKKRANIAINLWRERTGVHDLSPAFGRTAVHAWAGPYAPGPGLLIAPCDNIDNTHAPPPHHTLANTTTRAKIHINANAFTQTNFIGLRMKTEVFKL